MSAEDRGEGDAHRGIFGLGNVSRFSINVEDRNAN